MQRFPALTRRAFMGSAVAATLLTGRTLAQGNGTKLTHISASELAGRIAERDVSCVEVMKAYIERINEVNPKINAIVRMRAEEELLNEAKRADRDLMNGRNRGLLHGVPFTLKDNIETQGIVTTCGFPELAAYKPKSDATVAKRLKNAGGILLGKTNVPEFTMFADTTNLVYGRTKNPYDLSRFTGGSSGGEGAIIAACGSAFGIGTDIGSSIREPSHYCGIAGLKPTSGRVPDTGVLNCFPPFNAHWNCTGPMARYVEDLAIVTKVISGPDEHDPNTVDMPLRNGDIDLRGLRVAYFVEDGLSEPTEETQEIVRRCARKLSDAGAKVTNARPERFADSIDLWVFGMVPELGVALRQWLKEYATMAGSEVSVQRLALSDAFFEVLDFWSNEGRYSEQQRFSIGRRIQQFRSEMHAFMQDFDVLLCPVMNGPADPYEQERKKPQKLEDEYEELQGSGYSYCMAFNITGWPAASVPVGSSSAGLPIGVQVASKPWREDLVLTVAKELEQRIGGWRPPTL
jgi:amidase